MFYCSIRLSGTGADGHDGIVHRDVERTLENLGILGNKGMSNTNRTILNIMLDNRSELAELEPV
ncbi:hypothetical protein [uncultured Robinsoniella sp.]|uniref:hypothetical protein n=1 Tax=uncultured Robinsoniella sp. TaxID=904190 RepID=UPI00374E23C0